MEDKLKKEIADVVEGIFASKKDTEIRQRTEDALKASASTIETLTSEIEKLRNENDELKTEVSSAVASLEEVNTKVEEFETSVKEVEASKEEATLKIEDLQKQLNEKAEELEDIRKEAKAKERMEELASSGVVREDSDSQLSKVKEMSDEDFNAYKEELEAIKISIMSALDKEDKEVKEEASKKDGSVNTPPANVDPRKTVSAAMNMEVYPSDDLIAQYKDLGKALAEAMTKDK